MDKKSLDFSKILYFDDINNLILKYAEEFIEVVPFDNSELPDRIYRVGCAIGYQYHYVFEYASITYHGGWLYFGRKKFKFFHMKHEVLDDFVIYCNDNRLHIYDVNDNREYFRDFPGQIVNFDRMYENNFIIRVGDDIIPLCVKYK